MHGKNLTIGNIPKQLWSVAWPMMLSMFFHSLYNLVDAFWVAKISASAIAAVSISQIVLFCMVSLSMGVSVGTSVLVGQNIGANNKLIAEKILGQGYLLIIICSIIFTFLIYIFKAQLLVLSGAVGDIYNLAMPYFLVVTLGSILMFLITMTSFTFNAQGDSFTPTKLFAVSTVVNIILDPILIFGYFGFPKLGIAGAAYATLISQAVFLTLALRILMGSKMMIALRLENLKLRRDSVKQVLNIGLPASLNQVLNPLGFSALMYLVSAKFLEAGAAAFSIGFRIEFFAFIPAIGFGFGAMAMIGQNIGAGKSSRVHDILKMAIYFGAGAALVFSLLSFLFSKYIVAAFTNDPVVTEYAHLYFSIVPIGYAFFSVAFIEANVFQAIGRSWPGFWITLSRISISLILTIIAIKLLDLNIWSVWLAIVIGSIIASTFGLFWVNSALNSVCPRETNSSQSISEELLQPPIG